MLGTIRMPVTLKTVFSRLGIQDRFVVHPVCYNCHKVFQPGIDTATFCPACDLELFRPATKRLFDSVAEPGDAEEPFVDRVPYMVAPIQVLSVALAEFLTRPGMVSAVNSWKTRTTVAGELKSMQDAEVWNTLKGQDGNLFFFGPSADEEIRLGVTFSLDWRVCIHRK
jgi:hypothetical protein